MLRRAITRTIFTRFDSGNAFEERVRNDPEALLEIDARAPAEQLLRARDVGPRIADVTRALAVELALDHLAEHTSDRVRELVDARAATGGDIEYAAAHVRRRRRDA